MKDFGSWTGSIVTAFFSVNKLEIIDVHHLSKFTFFEWVLITLYLVCIATVGGIAGALIKESAAKLIDRWNGKKKELKQST